MAGEQNTFYSKEGTATGSHVALETAHITKYDHWLFENTHASQTLEIKIKGSNAKTIAADSSYSVSVTASPEVVTVKENNTTYRITATGK